MDPQVLGSRVLQEGAHGVGHAADPDLEAVAVTNLGGDEATDRDVRRAHRRAQQLGRGLVITLDDVVDLAHVDAVVDPVRHGQLGALLDDHDPGALNNRPVPEVGGTEVEEPFGIHGAGLEHHDVDRGDEPAVVVRDLPQVDRHVVGSTGIVLAPVVAREVQAEPEEVIPLGVALEHGPRPRGQARADLDLVQLVAPSRQRQVEGIGLTQTRPVVQPHAGLDQSSGLPGRDPACRLDGAVGHPELLRPSASADWTAPRCLPSR